MKIKPIIILIFTILSISNLFSNELNLKKIYFGSKGKLHPLLALVEIKNNIAHIEIVHNYYDMQYTLKYSEKLNKNSIGDTLFSSELTKIYKKEEKLYIICFAFKRFFTLELIDYETKFSQIELIRNNYYTHDTRRKSENYLDSILGKQNYKSYEFYSFFYGSEIWDKKRTLNSTDFKDSMNYCNQIRINQVLSKEQAKIENLRKLLSKNEFNFEEINTFLLANNFEKRIEKDVLSSMIQKNTETFLKVLESQKNDFKSSNLRKQFFSFGEFENEYFKPIYSAISTCKYESKYKKEILKSMKKGKRSRNKFIAGLFLTPTLCITGLIIAFR